MTTVIDKINTVNETIKNLTEFIKTDSQISKDFQDYVETIGMKNAPQSQIDAQSIIYIFERNLDNKSIPENYKEKSQLDNIQKDILNALSGAQVYVFEIKKILKNGFELYNMINEKTYTVTSLTKMNQYRGLGIGQFIIARIFEYEKEHFLIDITNILASAQKDEAMRYAVAKIIQTPELVYIDNPEKQKCIENRIDELYTKFIDCFGKDEVVTTNKLADDLISLFNDYAEHGDKPTADDIQAKLGEPETYKYFEVKEFHNSYENFLENSMSGFSSHKETYDVGIVFDKETGLCAIPFYKTFCKIFEAEDYKTVEGYEKCIESFLTNDGISANIIKKINSQYPNFMKIINEVYKSDMTLDELLQKYKSRFINQKIYSSTLVLYESKIFDNTLGLFEEESNKPHIDMSKVGRNDPCPCGSGKKFKKCCGARI